MVEYEESPPPPTTAENEKIRRERRREGWKVKHAETRLNLRSRASAVKYIANAPIGLSDVSARDRARSNLLRFVLIYGRRGARRSFAPSRSRLLLRYFTESSSSSLSFDRRSTILVDASGRSTTRRPAPIRFERMSSRMKLKRRSPSQSNGAARG